MARGASSIQSADCCNHNKGVELVNVCDLRNNMDNSIADDRSRLFSMPLETGGPAISVSIPLIRPLPCLLSPERRDADTHSTQLRRLLR